ncbi:maturase [Sinorhizobium meliloti]|uniref:maturase n=1 Tax=Rhizobium meliloti TaxID=382 RepID=UPI00398D1702
MQEARHQMPARAGRSGGRQGEALSEPGSDEATCPRCDAQSTGPGLLEAALARENLQRAWKRVKANKGAAGADGLSIEATAAHLRTSWPGIRERVLAGTYRPMPVRRVTIPKPDGGERELGIPTVTDRLIQQALLQVLQPLLDPASASTATASVRAVVRMTLSSRRSHTCNRAGGLSWTSTWRSSSTGSTTTS